MTEPRHIRELRAYLEGIGASAIRAEHGRKNWKVHFRVAGQDRWVSAAASPRHADAGRNLIAMARRVASGNTGPRMAA